jgi:Ca2+-binding RTX toxin-like protein
LENLIAGTSADRHRQRTEQPDADSLLGLDGADTLDGGAGADYLEGGAGNDTYIIDNIGDVIVEGVAGGIDTVIVMVDGLTIGANVIRLGGTAHVLIGGDDDNSLTGMRTAVQNWSTVAAG